MEDISKYDSRPALEQSLSSLEDFRWLTTERRKAHYERGERLTEWVVLGRFFLDSCGNIGEYISENIPVEVFPRLPIIMTIDEFWEYVNSQSHSGSGKDISISIRYGGAIPSKSSVCSVCGRLDCIESNPHRKK